MALRAKWQFMDRSVTHKIVYGDKKRNIILKANRLQPHSTHVFHSSGDNSALKSITKYLVHGTIKPKGLDNVSIPNKSHIIDGVSDM
jgi:hypothetical protein